MPTLHSPPRHYVLVHPVLSASELTLPNEEAAKQREEHHHHHKAEALVRGPAVAAAHDLGDLGIEFLDEIKTLADAVDNLVDVFAAV